MGVYGGRDDEEKGRTEWRHTTELKVEAVRLAESIGGSQRAERLGIPDSSRGGTLPILLMTNPPHR